MCHGEPLDGEKTFQSVHRIAGVLKAFGKQGLLGITDLANATGLPKSTTHRLVTALVVVGQQERRVDARPLVTGAPVYASEFEQPNMLHARILHSPHAHANILRIDTSRALALPGRGGRYAGLCARRYVDH